MNVRNLATNEVWINHAARDFWNVPDAVIPWHHAIRWLPPEDAVRAEDAHSRAIKTAQPQCFEFSARWQPDQLIRVENSICFEPCRRCQNGCGVVITLISILETGF